MKDITTALLTKAELETLISRAYPKIKGIPVYDCVAKETKYIPMVQLINNRWTIMVDIKESYVK